MLKLTPFELIVRVIPEVCTFIFAAYAFSKIRIDKKKYVIASLLLGISVFIIRFLPINYGVHTILNIIAMTIIANSINKIERIKAIKASIITAILLFVTEAINVFILSQYFKGDIDKILVNPTLKTIYGLPSLIVLAITVITYYVYLLKKGELRDE